MAITNAQQARQLYKNGKRVGLFGGMSPGAFGQATGGGYSDRERDSNRNNDNSGRNNPFEQEATRRAAKVAADQKAARDRENARIAEQTRIAKQTAANKAKREKFLADQKKERERVEKEKRRDKIISFAKNIPTPLNLAKKVFGPIIDKNNIAQKKNYLDYLSRTNPEKFQKLSKELVDEDLATADMLASDDSITSPSQRFGASDFKSKSLNVNEERLGDEDVKDILGTGYTDYLNRFNTTDDRGDNDGSNQLPPIISQQPIRPVTPLPVVGSTTSSDPFSLAPRFMGSTFDFSDDYGRTLAADGGRIGAQQGGIMPRLNELSGSVSSAEEMLQEINQRLDSAESTLGEGVDGGGSMFDRPQLSREESGFNFNFNTNTNNQKPFSPISGSIQNQMQNSFGMRRPASPIRQQRGFDFNRLIDAGVADPVRNKPIYAFGAKPAIPFADGGRTLAADGGMMMMRKEYRDLLEEDEMDDPTGGIMDLETGRQQYFLGKLVKKATRAVKKVAKSPIGKAALLYGLGSLGASALGKANTGTGTGFFSGLKGKLFGQAALGAKKVPGMGPLFKPATKGLLGKLGITKGGGSFMPTLKGGIGLGLGIPFALDALGVGKKEEEDGIDLDEYYKTQGIDIDAIRNNPDRILARRFMAEGGDAEPVAKKTMPLLDMDGQEMDLREEGGFVPLGRMERADDVPARLSKNEFVFTADAVRNAGEGDIDKGAEVMYNMMKNLESGGEVSEESQGLEGAREMFQTSQRLEEVL